MNGQYHENKARFQSLLLPKSIFVLGKESSFLKDEGNFEAFITVIYILNFHGSKYQEITKTFSVKKLYPKIYLNICSPQGAPVRFSNATSVIFPIFHLPNVQISSMESV